MTEGIDDSVQIAERDELVGVRVSAGLLFALGCLSGFYAACLVLIFVGSWVSHSRGRLLDAEGFLSPAIMLPALVMAVIGVLCMTAARAMREAQRWSAYLAMAFGAMFLLVCFFLVFDFFRPFHPEIQAPDADYALLLVPFFFPLGAWWCIYLNLSHVRAYFRRGATD